MQETFASAEASKGSSPGLEHDEIVKLPDGPAPVRVTCVDYGPVHAQQQLVEDLEDFLAQHRPEWSVVRWINVMNFHNFPELGLDWAYPTFWIICVVMAGSMLLFFRSVLLCSLLGMR